MVTGEPGRQIITLKVSRMPSSVLPVIRFTAITRRDVSALPIYEVIESRPASQVLVMLPGWYKSIKVRRSSANNDSSVEFCAHLIQLGSIPGIGHYRPNCSFVLIIFIICQSRKVGECRPPVIQSNPFPKDRIDLNELTST